jgi:hypothetical protein
MTIEELVNANKDMCSHSICVIRCRYNKSKGMSSDDTVNGCILYQDEYSLMPNVLRNLKVTSFKFTDYKLFGKLEIWVV